VGGRADPWGLRVGRPGAHAGKLQEAELLMLTKPNSGGRDSCCSSFLLPCWLVSERETNRVVPSDSFTCCHDNCIIYLCELEGMALCARPNSQLIYMWPPQLMTSLGPFRELAVLVDVSNVNSCEIVRNHADCESFPPRVVKICLLHATMITKLFRLESSLFCSKDACSSPVSPCHGRPRRRQPVPGGWLQSPLAERQHGVPGRGVDGVAAVSCPEPAGGGELGRLYLRQYLRLHCRRFLH
jgi:hypothetical protein